MIGDILKDTSLPECRVARKATGLSVLLIAFTVFYRHVELGYGFGEPLFVTLSLALIIFFVLGLFGGILAGSFYKTFLIAVDARRLEPCLPTFFVEWLFAGLVPALSVVAVGFLSSHS